MNTRKAFALIILAACSALVIDLAAQNSKDPHRPACNNPECLKARAFVKAHYCGAAPFANGPDDSCDLRERSKPRTGIKVLAEYHCEWDEAQVKMHCEQRGQPPERVRETLMSELHRAGLPAKAEGSYFTVWKAPHSGWLLAQANYSRNVGNEIELCEAIIIIDERSQPILLRKEPFKKTDADVPQATGWNIVDIADVEGNGTEDIVLEGDEYENHWFEVVRIRNGKPETIFSGLGYYL
jgi:hypothetical protein